MSPVAPSIPTVREVQLFVFVIPPEARIAVVTHAAPFSCSSAPFRGILRPCREPSPVLPLV